MSFRVLFVCMGNICRSPAAECVLRQRIKEGGLEGQVSCDSAGTIAYHQGNPPDARMRDELLRRGIPVDGRARQVADDDLGQFDLVLAMDRDNLAYLQALPGAREAQGRIRLFSEFCRHTDKDEVPDPYYGNGDGFVRVGDMIEDGVAGLLETIKAELKS